MSMSPMSGRPLVYIVEDDPVIRQLMTDVFLRHDHDAIGFPNALAFWQGLETARPDLVILDVMMPGEDGLSVCRRLRDTAAVPVIIASAKGESLDRILGLELGADDYLSKPFDHRELIARARAVLRRPHAAPTSASRTVIRFDGWMMDTVSRTVTPNGHPALNLTAAEFDVLALLVERGDVVSRLDIARHLGRPAHGALSRAIDVTVSRLRRKLHDRVGGQPIIRPVRNRGYVLTAEVEGWS